MLVEIKVKDSSYTVSLSSFAQGQAPVLLPFVNINMQALCTVHLLNYITSTYSEILYADR